MIKGFKNIESSTIWCQIGLFQKIHGIKPLSSLTLSYTLECHDIILLLGKVQLCIKTKLIAPK